MGPGPPARQSWRAGVAPPKLGVVGRRFHHRPRATVAAGGAGTGYRLAWYDELRSLPARGGGRRSLFRSDGIVPGSERRERYVFWPMGVPEPGAMRQWGHHAIDFVGRRHFDDPALPERFFTRAGPSPP